MGLCSAKEGSFSLIVIYTQTASLSVETKFNDRYRTVLSNSGFYEAFLIRKQGKRQENIIQKELASYFGLSMNPFFSAACLLHLIERVLVLSEKQRTKNFQICQQQINQTLHSEKDFFPLLNKGFYLKIEIILLW